MSTITIPPPAEALRRAAAIELRRKLHMNEVARSIGRPLPYPEVKR